MAKKVHVPKLCFHKSSGQYYVWNGKTKEREHFGVDPAVARQLYSQWVASNGGQPALPPPSEMRVSHAVEAYRRFAEVRYTDRREWNRIKLAMDQVEILYGQLVASSFRARAFKDVRERFLHGGKKKARSRNYVNKFGKAIQTAWRWLANEEIVPAECAASVRMVPPLKRGEGGKERPPVLPPADGVVVATLAKCPPLVAAMLQVQLLTGMRPGELREMRWCEVSKSPTQPVPLAGTGRTVAAVKCGRTVVWIYAPAGHKTLGRGKARAVAIGPAAQKILKRFAKNKDYIFRTRLGTQYRGDSYARAVERAAKAAGMPHWSPNQLRHAAATDIAEQFDDHTAASVLGHAAGSSASKVYIEQAMRKAAEAAAKCG